MTSRSFVLIAVMMVGGVAHAQPATPDPAADAALTEGRRLYELREWDAAIAKFKEAYKLRPDAPSLFNLAQSYRLKGDCIEAAGFYKTYKRKFPTEKNIDKVDQFIVDMEACAKTQPPKPVSVTPDPVTPDPVTTPPVTPVGPVLEEPEPEPEPPPPSGGNSTLKWGGIAAIGVGVIGIGLGTKFALDGKSASDDLKETCAISCTSAQALAIEEDGKSANKKAVIFTVVGGAAAVAGVVMFVLSRSGGSDEAPAVSITPTQGGATATYTVGF